MINYIRRSDPRNISEEDIEEFISLAKELNDFSFFTIDDINKNIKVIYALSSHSKLMHKDRSRELIILRELSDILDMGAEKLGDEIDKLYLKYEASFGDRGSGLGKASRVLSSANNSLFAVIEEISRDNPYVEFSSSLFEAFTHIFNVLDTKSSNLNKILDQSLSSLRVSSLNDIKNYKNNLIKNADSLLLQGISLEELFNTFGTFVEYSQNTELFLNKLNNSNFNVLEISNIISVYYEKDLKAVIQDFGSIVSNYGSRISQLPENILNFLNSLDTNNSLNSYDFLNSVIKYSSNASLLGDNLRDNLLFASNFVRNSSSAIYMMDMLSQIESKKSEDPILFLDLYNKLFKNNSRNEVVELLSNNIFSDLRTLDKNSIEYNSILELQTILDKIKDKSSVSYGELLRVSDYFYRNTSNKYNALSTHANLITKNNTNLIGYFISQDLGLDFNIMNTKLSDSNSLNKNSEKLDLMLKNQSKNFLQISQSTVSVFDVFSNYISGKFFSLIFNTFDTYSESLKKFYSILHDSFVFKYFNLGLDRDSYSKASYNNSLNFSEESINFSKDLLINRDFELPSSIYSLDKDFNVISNLDISSTYNSESFSRGTSNYDDTILNLKSVIEKQKSLLDLDKSSTGSTKKVNSSFFIDTFSKNKSL